MSLRLHRPVAAIAILSLAACASIVSDSKEVVTVSSSPISAHIAVADQSGVEVYRGTTPRPLRSMPVRVTSMGRNLPSPFSRMAIIRRLFRSIAGSTTGTSATSSSGNLSAG